MIARKCDICGKFFLPYLIDANRRKAEYYGIAERIESIDCGGKTINRYDLCEDCHRAFKKIVKNNKEN
jgi:hypothetical protein